VKCRSPAVASLLVLATCSALGAAEGQNRVASQMQQFVENQTVAGAVTIVVRKGQIVSFDCVGLADIVAQRPMTEDTMFWIASMTKPITATAVLVLQDEGKLSIDSPVAMYIPEFNELKVTGGGSPARPVTIRDLMMHTSGVANPPTTEAGENPTLAEITVAIANQPLQFEPGSKWKYGTGLTVAGRIVEIVSGQPFDAFVELRICRPLSMNNTTFYPNAEQRQRLATIYKMNKESRQLEPASASFINADAQAPRRAPNPSGGLCSTARDYCRFLQMIASGGELEGKRILSPAAVKRMTSIQTGDLVTEGRPGAGWGLGWFIVREPEGISAALSAGSYGHGGGLGTQAWIDPMRQAVMVLMIARGDLGASAENNLRATFASAAVEQLK
jgi:CubicO group peptidase (beta-lactamase class C family)